MNIVNWERVFNESNNFKNRSPTKWAFVEEFLDKDFYEKLFETYPKFDDSWALEDSYDKISYRKFWKRDENRDIITEYNEEFSKPWNDFMGYAWSEEFINKLVEFSGVKVTNLRQFCFMNIGKNGFQLPHESKILFEPYNLNNSALIVLDGPEAAHGVRKIVKDVERRAIQLTYEPYSSVNGWYGTSRKDISEPLDL